MNPSARWEHMWELSLDRDAFRVGEVDRDLRLALVA